MKGKKKLAIFMAAVMLSQVLSWSGASQEVFAANAEFVKTQNNTDIGTNNIAKPQSGEGGWSYVWLGKFEDVPVLYRVLTPSTQAYNSEEDNAAGRRTMFLDCDSVVAFMPMGEGTSEWENSRVYERLNGDFLSNKVFSTQEEKAIVSSTRSKDASDKDKEELDPIFDNYYVPLKGERVFVLDAREAARADYGYPHTLGGSSVRTKRNLLPYTDNFERSWHLRNCTGNDNSLIVAGDSQEPELEESQLGGDKGSIVERTIYEYFGVSPAFNVNLANVILSSKLGKIDDKNQYKLTLKDEDFWVKLTGAVTRASDKVSIPLAVDGTKEGNSNHFVNADNLSVVITSKPWNKTTGWGEGNTLLQYTMLDVSASAPYHAKEGSFVLNTEEVEGVCGKDYFAYVMVEDNNDTQECDYASEPVEIFIPAEEDDPVDPISSMSLNTNKLYLQTHTSRVITATLINDSIKSAKVTGEAGHVKVSFADNKITVKATRKTGDTQITVTSTKGIVKKVNVHVQTDKVVTKHLSLSKNSVKLYTNNVPKYIKVKANPDYVSTLQKVKVKVEKGKSYVKASYDESTGYIRLLGKKAGTASISVKAGNQSEKLTVTVKDHDLVLKTEEFYIQSKKDGVIGYKLFADSIDNVISNDKTGKKIKSVSYDDDNIYIKSGANTGSTSITVKTKSGIKKRIKVYVQREKVVTKNILFSTSNSLKLSLSGRLYSKRVSLKLTAVPDIVSTNQPIIVAYNAKESDKKVNVSFNENTNVITVTPKKTGSATIKIKSGKVSKDLRIRVYK